MRVLITGAEGFIGKNLSLFLSQQEDMEVIYFTRDDSVNDLPSKLVDADFIFHLAGVNRPDDTAEFKTGNTDFTQALCDAVTSASRKIPIVFSSSIHAELDNPYGQSKLAAEKALTEFGERYNNPVYIYRLPNVFGKWAKANYNSAVASFCHNIARGLPIQINDPNAVINLVYIDDVLKCFMSLLNHQNEGISYPEIEPIYKITVGELADQLYNFKASRDSLITENVGTGLVRALYSTYVSYLPSNEFSYAVPAYGDARGVFVEMLKTKDAGQFSFLSAMPGVTRGGHFHHSKVEKFLVIKGKARFTFKHMSSGEYHELFTTGESPEIVETVPGWTHDITNIGDEELICMLWANEIFDRENPDTYACPVIKPV